MIPYTENVHNKSIGTESGSVVSKRLNRGRKEE